MHDYLRHRLGGQLSRPGDVIRVRVGVDDVGRAQGVLEDGVEHWLDHLELRVY